DGATPSGNSVAAMNLLRLGRLTGNPDLEEKAYKQLNAFGGMIREYPMGYTHMLMALLFINGKAREIVLVGNREDQNARRMLEMINTHFHPFEVAIFKDSEAVKAGITDIATYTEDQIMINDKTTAYVCENFACRAPVTDLQEFMSIISD
ncbi:MAG: thioredoxin domain-containing protein, partial [Clostridiaceae bacterium]|nr:thioredoxin domain-containing protein [Clostridiaceae bacterium]